MIGHEDGSHTGESLGTVFSTTGSHPPASLIQPGCSG